MFIRGWFHLGFCVFVSITGAERGPLFSVAQAIAFWLLVGEVVPGLHCKTAREIVPVHRTGFLSWCREGSNVCEQNEEIVVSWLKWPVGRLHEKRYEILGEETELHNLQSADDHGVLRICLSHHIMIGSCEIGRERSLLSGACIGFSEGHRFQRRDLCYLRIMHFADI